MRTLSTVVTINRPSGEVFDFVADHTNGPKWQRGLAEVHRCTPGPLGVGTEHVFVREFAGRRLETFNRFTAFEPGRRVEFEFPDGWISGRASYEVNALGPTSCQLTSAMTFRLRRASWLEPLLARLMAKDTRRDEQALRTLLEGRGDAPDKP